MFKPFVWAALMSAYFLALPADAAQTCAEILHYVRTLRGKIAELAKTIWRYAKTEEGQHTMECIRAVLNQDVEAMARLAPLRRYAKVGQGAGRARRDDGVISVASSGVISSPCASL